MACRVTLRCGQVSAVALVMLSFLLWFNSSFNITYGPVVAGWGAGLFIAAMLLAAVGCMSFYGAAKHNKCMLITSSAVVVLALSVQAIVATNMRDFTAPAFTDELVDECIAVRARPASTACVALLADQRAPARRACRSPGPRRSHQLHGGVCAVLPTRVHTAAVPGVAHRVQRKPGR